MALGSWVGAALAQAQGNLAPVGMAIGLPVVLACASVWVLARQPADDPTPGQASVAGAFTLADESPRPLRQRPVQAVFLVFFASMAAYNIWPVLVPFGLRAQAPSPAVVAALALALTLQPLLFGAVQLLVAHGLKGRPTSDGGLLIGLVLAHGLSLLALRLAAQQSQPVAFAVLLLLGGGLLMAVIYPVCSLVLMRALEPVPIAQRSALQRRLIVQFGLAGDLGQLAGGGLLASELVTAQPLDLFLLLGGLALPALAALSLKASSSRAV